MEITLVQLQSMFETTNETILNSYIPPLNKFLEGGNINTELRVAMFIAQVGHESGGFTYTRENLNYSAQRLLEVFPSHFTETNVSLYAHNPEKIGNRIYSNRMGNGNEESGDGYLFRGRGLIQLTGRSLYTEFATSINADVTSAVSYLETPEGAVESAVWYWNKYNLNKDADAQDIIKATITINGNKLGLNERERLYDKALSVFGC